MIRFALGLALALGMLSPTAAQDHRGESTTTSATYQGVTARAPIPTDLHIRNEGGSDGAGLCVISSIIANGRYQGVPGLEGGKDSQIWRAAKAAPGGYSPTKLEALVERVMPGETWATMTGTDPSILSKLSAAGYPIGATMNTGAQYGYQPIHHMVSLIHHEPDGYACVVDNNDPGKYHWMPTQEFNRRWVDGSAGWAWIWTRNRNSTTTRLVLVPIGLILGLIVYLARPSKE